MKRKKDTAASPAPITHIATEQASISSLGFDILVGKLLAPTTPVLREQRMAAVVTPIERAEKMSASSCSSSPAEEMSFDISLPPSPIDFATGRIALLEDSFANGLLTSVNDWPALRAYVNKHDDGVETSFEALERNVRKEYGLPQPDSPNLPQSSEEPSLERRTPSRALPLSSYGDRRTSPPKSKTPLSYTQIEYSVLQSCSSSCFSPSPSLKSRVKANTATGRPFSRSPTSLSTLPNKLDFRQVLFILI